MIFVHLLHLQQAFKTRLGATRLIPFCRWSTGAIAVSTAYLCSSVLSFVGLTTASSSVLSDKADHLARQAANVGLDMCTWYSAASVMTTYPVKLQVHYSSKDAAKASGAKWNSEAKAWEARDPAALHRCRVWAGNAQVSWTKEWLQVPYEMRGHAKAAGARYDRHHHCWYAPLGPASLAEELNQYRIRWR
eukprot:4545-Heterococcus_DN1.PRE.1